MRSAGGEAEAGDDFVEDEQRAGFARPLAQGFEEGDSGPDDSHISGDWLYDHGGDLGTLPLHVFGEGVGIVVRENDGVAGEVFRNAGRVRQAESGYPRARFCQKAIAMAVVAALEFDDLGSPGKTSRHAKSAHHRFCA